jgi:hypothetical protein
MNGAFMHAIYPWARLVSENQHVRVISFHQTDYSEEYYPSIVNTTNALLSRSLPLWFPYNLAGVPNLNVAVTEYTHPLRLICYLLFTPSLQTQAWLTITVFFGFLGMYVFLRALNIRTWAALIGAAAWALNGTVVFWGLYECFTTTNATIPWILYSLRVAISNGRIIFGILAGILWGLLFHNGHLQLAYMWSLALSVYCASLLVQVVGHSEFDAARRRFLVISSTGLVGVLISAPVWVRTMEWLPLLHRATLTLDEQLTNGMSVEPALLMMLGPFPRHDYSSAVLELQAFVGIVPLLLVPVGIVSGFRSRRCAVIGAGAALVVGVTTSFAWKPIITLLHYGLPLFRSLHLHFLVHFAHLGIAVLAAIGADSIAEHIERRARSHQQFAAALVLGLLLVMHAAQASIAFYRTTPSQPFGPSWNFPTTPLIEHVMAAAGPYRTIQIRARPTKEVWYRPMLTGRLAAIFNINGALGYESLTPSWVFKLWRTVELGTIDDSRYPAGFYPSFYDDNVNVELLKRLSVGLIMATPEARLHASDGTDLLKTGQIEEIYRGPDGALYRVPGALPRAFLVGSAQVADERTALSGLFNGAFDPRRSVSLIPGNREATIDSVSTDAESHDIGDAQIIGETDNRLSIAISAKKAGFLVVNDSWAPGWVATVDGMPVTILRSNYAFRALRVPQGDHRVELAYRPTFELVAIATEAVTLLFVTAICAIFCLSRNALG